MFARKPPACPREPTDEVVPLPFFDDTLLLASSIHTMMYVFDKVLDPEKLEDAIERLAQRPDWRKISARIRRNVGPRYDVCALLCSPMLGKGRLGVSHPHKDLQDTAIDYTYPLEV